METIEFNALSRCDSCGSQAYHAASKNESELLFCAHHMNRHHNKLLEQGWEITTDITGLEGLGTPVQVNL